VKAISIAILDRSLQKGMRDTPANPSENPEFVLLHVDGIDSMGFCTHYKMPHYVTSVNAVNLHSFIVLRLEGYTKQFSLYEQGVVISASHHPKKIS
jgi:alpha-D-ribose 1-methylphosphonate 5-triphosphate synthase subunit PhnI